MSSSSLTLALRGGLVTLLLTTQFLRTSYAQTCPNLCSSHGTCSVDFTCTCFDGFTGADCSQRTCPIGPAWSGKPDSVSNSPHADAVCSAHGICDSLTGSCECAPGVTGDACQYREEDGIARINQFTVLI